MPELREIRLDPAVQRMPVKKKRSVQAVVNKLGCFVVSKLPSKLIVECFEFDRKIATSLTN